MQRHSILLITTEEDAPIVVAQLRSAQPELNAEVHPNHPARVLVHDVVAETYLDAQDQVRDALTYVDEPERSRLKFDELR
jgi:hypothetical protein